MPQSTVVGIQQRTKKPAEVRTLTFDFADKLAEGDTLTGTATMTYATGLTPVATERVLNTVLSRFSGGAEGLSYAVRCSCATTNGDTLILDVIIRADSSFN